MCTHSYFLSFKKQKVNSLKVSLVLLVVIESTLGQEIINNVTSLPTKKLSRVWMLCLWISLVSFICTLSGYIWLQKKLKTCLTLKKMVIKNKTLHHAHLKMKTSSALWEWQWDLSIIWTWWARKTNITRTYPLLYKTVC